MTYVRCNRIFYHVWLSVLQLDIFLDSYMYMYVCVNFQILKDVVTVTVMSSSPSAYRSFVIEKQPPQVIKTANRFSSTVR